MGDLVQSVLIDEVMAMSRSAEGIVQIHLGLKSFVDSDDKKHRLQFIR